MSEENTVTSQRKIGSGFGRDSTAADVIAGIDLTGKTAIVTGGYSGLGLETVRALASAGATVVVPARRPEHARDVLAVQTLAALDMPYIEHWCAQHGTLERLHAVIASIPEDLR